MNRLFDLEKVIKESGLSQDKIEQIKQDVREEFPSDEMMWELHVIRAIKSEQDKLAKKPKAQIS